MMSKWTKAAVLDDKGRCCGRKPLVYKRPTHYLYCSRCNRGFSPDGRQIENWAYKGRADGSAFIARRYLPLAEDALP